MAVVRVTRPKIQKVIIINKDQLLELADKLAEGLSDAIKEFFIAKDEIDPEKIKQLDDFEGPDEESVAGIDNEYFEDDGDPV